MEEDVCLAGKKGTNVVCLDALFVVSIWLGKVVRGVGKLVVADGLITICSRVLNPLPPNNSSRQIFDQSHTTLSQRGW